MVNEIRKDYVLERYVIISPKRAKRPKNRVREVLESKRECPFCKGKEKDTPPPIKEVPKGNWKVRIVPNKYPALVQGPFRGEEGGGFFRHFKPYGYHEILIETPDHKEHFHELSAEHIELSLRVMKERYLELMRDDEIVYVTLFKNEGKKGGASLGHVHTQIIASPIFPEVIMKEMQASERYYENERRCPHCDVIKVERKLKKRVVMSNRDFLVICPYASIWPYETRIFPKRHFSDFGDIKRNEIKTLALTLKKLLTRYAVLLDNPPYNITYHTFPASDFWHFHIDIYPREKIHAGFERFGLYINEVPPERAAKKLRNS